MSIQLSKIPPHILKDVTESLIENNRHINSEAEARFEMATMSAESIFDVWMNWQGIIGYSGLIVLALDSFRAAKVPE